MEPRNVYESWPLYDTVLIANDPDGLNKIEGFVPTFKELGSLRDVPFFNVRNRASAGVAYNNF